MIEFIKKIFYRNCYDIKSDLDKCRDKLKISQEENEKLIKELETIKKNIEEIYDKLLKIK